MELKRQLQSLACAKFKILKKHPPGRDVDTNDSFSFNIDFSAPLQKIKISTIASRVENPEERKETKDRIDEERRHQTEVRASNADGTIRARCYKVDAHIFHRQACIVRIMKDRKAMSHNDLVNEVTRQLATRFSPNPAAIKKRIEGLIEVSTRGCRPLILATTPYRENISNEIQSASHIIGIWYVMQELLRANFNLPSS